MEKSSKVKLRACQIMKNSNCFFVLLGAAFIGATFVVPVSAQSLLKQFPVEGGASKPRPKGPAQEKLAAKSAFPSAKTADLKGSIPAANLAAATKMVGKTVTVVGTVTDIYAPKSNSIVLLNFAKDYKTAVVGAIKARDFAKFPVLKSLKGKKVALRGSMVIFKGSPEIELSGAGAIRIVK